jgi:hypothetical protein
MNKPSFQEWFCLRDGRRNFEIDPVTDQRFLFGQSDWQREIDTRLQRAQLLGNAVRLLWWGQFGIGKTHRLHHTEFLIKTKPYGFYPRYAVATDVQEKTGFERLHVELMGSLGRSEMQELVSTYLLRVKNKEAGVPTLDDICSSSADTKQALRSFGGDNPNLIDPAWRFLSGFKLKADERALAGVTKDQLDSSHDFAAVLSAIARIIQIQTNKELLFLIDEGENLLKITNKTAEGRWQESLRAILDIKHLSIVVTVGAERFQDVPAIFIKPDIVRRIQKDNYVLMEAYKEDDVTRFMTGLLEQLIDPERRAKMEQEAAFAKTHADYEAQLFPFTGGAFEKFCENAVVDPRTAKPSEIIARLNKVAADAYLADRRLIDRNHLTEMGIA